MTTLQTRQRAGLLAACAAMTLLLVTACGQQTAAPESDDDLKYVFQGMRDQLQGEEPRVDIHQQQANIRDFMQRRVSAGAEKARGDGAQYLERFVEEGGTLTDSGLAYRIIEEGNGDKPSAEDTVEVHYEGRLTDGTVFDSSHQRGETVSFPLEGVIPGWTEGVQLIAPGGKIELVIPPDLAYGDQGSPPAIPGGATLVFEVELIDVK